MQDDIPMPPSHGCIVFHTPNEPSRIRWPMPNSIRNNGMPSNISITKNGIRNAPANTNTREKKYPPHHTISFGNNGMLAKLRNGNQWSINDSAEKHNMLAIPSPTNRWQRSKPQIGMARYLLFSLFYFSGRNNLHAR